MAERAVRTEIPGLRWSAGAPEPVLIAGETRTLFAFYRWEDGSSEDAVQTAEFVGCTSVTFGFPNDEALQGHPLWGRGLEFYALHEVEESSWLDGVRSIEKAHPDSLAVLPFADTRHFVLTFHDTTLEALARQIIALDRYRNMHEAVSALAAAISAA
jgi:hypothetical protein